MKGWVVQKMEPKSNSIELSKKKSSIIDVRICSKYPFVNITFHSTFLEDYRKFIIRKLMKFFKVLPEEKKS